MLLAVVDSAVERHFAAVPVAVGLVSAGLVAAEAELRVPGLPRPQARLVWTKPAARLRFVRRFDFLVAAVDANQAVASA